MESQSWGAFALEHPIIFGTDQGLSSYRGFPFESCICVVRFASYCACDGARFLSKGAARGEFQNLEFLLGNKLANFVILVCCAQRPPQWVV